MKRGQISVFVIIAIVVIGLAVFFFLFSGNFALDSVSSEVQPIQVHVQNCVASTAQDALAFIGASGGYYDVPELSNIIGISYHYYDKQSHLPSKETMTRELEKYMNTMLPFCTKNFASFPDYEVTQKPVASIVTISDERVTFKVRYPLTIMKGADSYTLENFEAEADVRLGVIHDMLNLLMEDQLAEKDDLCISCVGNLAEEYEVLIDMHSRGNGEVTFFIIDQKSIINEEAYLFKFVNKYDED